MINKDQLVTVAVSIIKSTGAVSDEDVAWCHSIISRVDGQDGIDQITPIVLACEEYNKDKGKLTVWQDYLRQKEIAHRVHTCKVLFYKQKRVMIAVPQRKKHPRSDVPNLGNFLIPQHFRGDIISCYGLGYAESRQYFVDRALAEGVYTHIMFIDDDILLPIDAIGRLVDSNYAYVGANYVKRNALLESTATTIVRDKNLVFANALVEPKQNDFTALKAGCLGLGATLISTDVFKRLPKPHFHFVWEKDTQGNHKRLLIGEDSALCQDSLMAGFEPMVIPGLVPLHVDFKTGAHYGPEWLVDPATRRLRKEYEQFYCKFMVDPKELAAPDIDDTFTKFGIK